MADIGMYYPDVFVQDEAWLKAAALYWPKLARLMPADYPQHDSPTAQILTAELDFFVDIDPEPYAREVGHRFLMWLRENDDDWYDQPPSRDTKRSEESWRPVSSSRIWVTGSPRAALDP